MDSNTTGKQARKQAGKQASRQTNRREHKQAGKPANKRKDAAVMAALHTHLLSVLQTAPSMQACKPASNPAKK